jgi:NADPH:quinone reductase-like Zn-dependent oxidoreductase
MRACFYDRYGGPEVLRSGILPDPVPGLSEVLVQLETASVAPLDWKMRAGLLASHFTPVFPKIPGRDGTGTILNAGADVTGIAQGDRVCVMAPPASAAGTYAELIACPAALVVPLPDALSMREGAALINAGLSAWISVIRTAKVEAGQRVLVHAGAGAVGGLIVQLCRHLGAKVTATCRASNKDYVHSLGAAHAIGYDTEDFTAVAEPQDIVFDLIGGETHARSYSVLKRGGHLVWLTALPITDLSANFGVRVTRAMISDDAEAVASILDLAAKGVLKAQIAGTMPLAEAAEAHKRMQAGAVTRGRLLLDI